MPGLRGACCPGAVTGTARDYPKKVPVEELFEIGKIVKTHGLKGRVKVNSYLVDPGRVLRRVDEVILDRNGVRKGPLKVAKWEPGGRNVLLCIDGIESSEAAETLVGWDVLIPTSHLDPPDEGEFYWRDLIGMKIVSEDGALLGTLTEIFPAGGADVYVCTGDKGETLFPAIADVVLKVDVAAGVMTVRILEGMQ